MLTTRGRLLSNELFRPTRLNAGALTLRSGDCYDASTHVSTLTYRVLTTTGERVGAYEHATHSARWTSAPRRSFGPSSRNTSRSAQPVGSQALVERYGLGVSSATVRNVLAELETARAADPPAHQCRSHADRRRLPLLRRVDRRCCPAVCGRAADDPPPVRPGRVRQRALVPPRRDDPRRADPLGRPRDAGQAARRAHPPCRSGRRQRADGEPDPRAARGLDQAGRGHARRGRCHRPGDPQPRRRAC